MYLNDYVKRCDRHSHCQSGCMYNLAHRQSDTQSHNSPVCVHSVQCTGTKHFRHQERSHLLIVCSIVYKVIRWSLCELKRDLLYFLDICNDIIS